MDRSFIRKETILNNGIRKFFFTKYGYIIEGDLNGTNQVFYSKDIGLSWNNVNYLKKGYKSFYILYGDSKNILGYGSKTYLPKDNKLLLYNIEEEVFREVADFNSEGGFGYVQPITKNKDLHIVIDDRDLVVYSFQNGEMNKLEKAKLPDNTSNWVKSVFLSEECYIISTRKNNGHGKVLSWISFNKGAEWEEFEHEKGYRLINSSSGDLFVCDNDNNILKGTLSNADSHLKAK